MSGLPACCGEYRRKRGPWRVSGTARSGTHCVFSRSRTDCRRVDCAVVVLGPCGCFSAQRFASAPSNSGPVPPAWHCDQSSWSRAGWSGTPVLRCGDAGGRRGPTGPAIPGPRDVRRARGEFAGADSGGHMGCRPKMRHARRSDRVGPHPSVGLFLGRAALGCPRATFSGQMGGCDRSSCSALRLRRGVSRAFPHGG